jgi:hypothetical protein
MINTQEKSLQNKVQKMSEKWGITVNPLESPVGSPHSPSSEKTMVLNSCHLLFIQCYF